MQILKWKELKSTVVPKLLKAPFPKCGVKYTSQFGRGLVLIKYDVCNKKMVMEKGKAAGDNSLAFIIPKVVANVYNI